MSRSPKSRSAKPRGNKIVRRGINAWLHDQSPADAPWRFLPWLLLLAFMARAAVALGGDFVIHPDEIMQYLEQAHRLIYGNGVMYWEFFYGARSWLVPCLAALAIGLCKIIGLEEPVYYIGAVKLLFCLISILIPWGMYVFCRRHFNEKTARLALISGVLWYELIGFAHKPMTEFVATAILLALLAMMPLSSNESRRRFAAAAILGVLLTATRLQYAPAAAFVLLAIFWHGGKNARWSMIGGGLLITVAVGIFEFMSWGAPFYSYYFNAHMNFIIGAGRVGESSILHMPGWLLLSSGGLILAAFGGAFSHFRRRGFVLVLILLIMLPHMLQNHREYRFIFAVIPLWLILFADFITVVAVGKRAMLMRHAAVAAVAFISVLGILNTLPWQSYIYTGFSQGTEKVRFITEQDPIFKIYRRLAADDSVRGVMDFTRPYFNGGGYYYLHHAVPFYDRYSSGDLINDDDIGSYVSHIITDRMVSGDGKVVTVRDQERLIPSINTDRGRAALPLFATDNSGQLMYWDAFGRQQLLSNYELDAQFGELMLWKTNSSYVREWKSYEVIAAAGLEQAVEIILGEQAPLPPPQYGIEFIK